jgi:hypothetical protein
VNKSGTHPFNRLFEVVLWGLAIAIIVTLRAYVTQGTFAASNFLPFLYCRH